ncbi:unnamed protein product [Rotaria sp. Silwood2]|nr:unnamed protein product [Rotaria sp. Silwood2]
MSINTTLSLANSLDKLLPVFPWFGMDISETLVKLVYFKPLYLTPDKIRTEVNIDSHRITILHLDSRPLTDTSIGKSL